MMYYLNAFVHKVARVLGSAKRAYPTPLILPGMTTHIAVTTTCSPRAVTSPNVDSNLKGQIRNAVRRDHGGTGRYASGPVVNATLKMNEINRFEK